MGKKKRKRLRHLPVTQGDKIQVPRSSEAKDTNELPPHFALEHLSPDKRYCLDACEQKERAAFAKTLHDLSKMAWREINNTPKHGKGWEPIPRKAIKASLNSSIITLDVDKFMAFRFFGKAPMVGLRNGRVFYVLWLDPKFKLYDHG